MSALEWRQRFSARPWNERARDAVAQFVLSTVIDLLATPQFQHWIALSLRLGAEELDRRNSAPTPALRVTVSPAVTEQAVAE